MGDIQIENKQVVLDALGRWPSFHDAEVVTLELTRALRIPSVRLTVYVFNVLGSIDDKGHYVRSEEQLLVLTFRDVADVSFEEFNQQNVMSDLHMELGPDGRIMVEVNSLFGLYGGFTCASVAVESCTALDSEAGSDWRARIRGTW